MALKRNGRLYRLGGRREKSGTQELASRLAPLEERKGKEEILQAAPNGKPSNDDTIRIDSTMLKLPDKLVEDEREGADIFRLHPVVVGILVFMLAFILFVAWQISLMPSSAK